MSKQQVITLTLNPSMDKTIMLQELKVGGLNRAEDIRLDPGGKGINVARIVHTFGASVTAAGFIAGGIGKRIIGELDRSGIHTAFVEVPGETRTNMKLVDQKQRTTTEVNEPGFTVSESQLSELNQLLDELLPKASVLVLGGSLPKGAPPELYHHFIIKARKLGVRTILDADGEALVTGIKAIPFAVKPNQYELEQLVQRKLDTKEEIVRAGKQLLAQGITLVIISMGADGAIVMSGEEAYMAKPFPIEALSTVGAGDSMVAVLAQALLQNSSLEDVARWSTAAGTITASKAGTQVCEFEEIRSRAGDIYIQAL
ncbi:1-phosphofructokinase [Paenibacillus sp. FSL H8-0537]|uniref:1-phosphofructokinase n=1 Tax=Paenibacillus sp. FSL H8-0537 TaxID=2921399 RepID=UPI003101B2AB